MWKLGSFLGLFCFVLLCASVDLVTGRGNSTWLTLNGDKPLVIARDGFSGLYPECSFQAYSYAAKYSLPNSLFSCDVHLTKDGLGICFPNIDLGNASTVTRVYPNGFSTYDVNGISTTGWFSLDFTIEELQNVFLTQGIYFRLPSFDGYYNILTVEDVPNGVWLSVPYDAFYSQHNLSMTNFVRSTYENSSTVKYISSPELGFLKSIASDQLKYKPKLVFECLGINYVDPSMNKTYGELLKGLNHIKNFVDGILVSKQYILPIDKNNYLRGATNLVSAAHVVGLEVFASGFLNDAHDLPYDYSYDPVLEYLAFIDNGNFSVDGVLSDFPLTASAAIDCFAHMGKNDIDRVNVTVISNEGASGDLPGSTDAAYIKAVSDGADVIDCSVQMTTDRVLFCMGSFDLSNRTHFPINSSTFAYDLTWETITNYPSSMDNPYENVYAMFRNPRGNSVGKLMKLDEFLEYASSQPSLSGVLISIEDAPYQAKNMNITGAVSETLSNTGYKKKVMIRSSEPAVLQYLNNKYEKVYVSDGNVTERNISDISAFASSVVLSKTSVFPAYKGFITISNATEIVSQLKASGLSVYVQLFRNEFISQPYNFFSDATVEINTHVSMGIDGIITDFPATAARYKKNRCLGTKATPPYMAPVQQFNLFS